MPEGHPCQWTPAAPGGKHKQITNPNGVSQLRVLSKLPNLAYSQKSRTHNQSNSPFHLPFPVTIHLGHTSVSLHEITEFAGIFIAFRYMLYLKRKNGDSIASENRLWVIIGATAGALFGSRILGALEDVPQWRAAPSFWLYLYSNKTIVGGLLGGLIGVELTKKIVGVQSRTGDLFVFPLLLAMIVGRIGCFSMGVYEMTYGHPSSLPWAMNLGDGIPRHPVALYEIIFLILLWVALAAVRKRVSLRNGSLFILFLSSYLAFRFLLDFIKPGWRYFLNLGSIQLACLAGLIYYSPYILRPRRLLKKD